VTRCGSPPLGNLGLPYLRGDLYKGLPGNPLGGGGGGVLGGGSSGGENTGLPWQMGAVPLMRNNNLKGTMLAIFDRN
jgi:hypothetical protein